MSAISAAELEQMKAKAPEVSELLRLMATPSRLLLLCQLSQGEASVGELEQAVGIRQPALSQHLADLRQHKLVSTRRQSRSIFYRIADPRVQQLLAAMHAVFCADFCAEGPSTPKPPPPSPDKPSADGAARFARVDPVQ